ncbi:MAG TPA: helix-turn-helix domain-containing protein [Nocardioides sp.]|nr:helix-turn-helix domain-containing protein [Nocardioides sp.]
MSNDTGERVRALRTARAVAQADLAASVGVSKSYLSHIEAGRRPVSNDLLARLADALAVDVAQLETGTPADANEDLQLKLAFAEMSLRNGEWDLARQEFQAVMDRAGTLPLERFVDEATWGLARAEEATGSLEQAILTYESLLEKPSLSPGVPRTTVSVRLAMAYSECGDLARAVDVGEQALAHLERLEPPEDVAVHVELISTLAGCYLERGDLTRAQILIDRALALATEAGSARARGAAAWNAAVIAQARHDAVGARLHADRALALFAELDNARFVAMLRVVSAGLLLRQAQPDPEAALPALRLALVELQDVGTRLDLGYARTEQARALLAAGDLAGAGDTGRRALLDLATGDRLQTGHALLVVGRVAMAKGDTEDALALLRQAANALEESEASRQAGAAWRELGEAYVELGRSTEAIEALRRASDLAGATYNPLRPALAAAGETVTA